MQVLGWHLICSFLEAICGWVGPIWFWGCLFARLFLFSLERLWVWPILRGPWWLLLASEWVQACSVTFHWLEPAVCSTVVVLSWSLFAAWVATKTPEILVFSYGLTKSFQVSLGLLKSQPADAANSKQEKQSKTNWTLHHHHRVVVVLAHQKSIWSREHL